MLNLTPILQSVAVYEYTAKDHKEVLNLKSRLQGKVNHERLILLLKLSFPSGKLFLPELRIFCQSFSIKLSLGSVWLEHLPQVRTKYIALLGLSVKYHLNGFKGQVHALASSFWTDFLNPAVLLSGAGHQSSP